MKSIEDQPRYVIDHGVSTGADTKILPEEQERAINKLLKAAGHALNEDERDILLKLMERLHQEAERVRSLRKMTVGDKPLDSYLSAYNKKKSTNHSPVHKPMPDIEDTDLADSEEETEEPVRRTPVQKTVVGFKPDEVVKRYIECWNQQKFGAEFECFSRDFLRTERDAYVNARHNYYQKQLAVGGMRIQLGEILSSELSGGQAEVVATKVIQTGNRKPQEEKDLYRLKLEHGRWVINGVEPQGV